MKAITSAQMRELDKVASSEFDIPGVELMRRAGRGVASIAAYIADHGRMGDPFIQLIAGRGNNGGDAFAAACFLHEEEFEVEVLLAGTSAEVTGDALRHLGKMRAAGIPLTELATKDAWEDALHDADSGGIIVDGVLGIGVNGPPRGPIGAAIHYINKISEDNIVVSIDVPSGLDADTGASPGETVIADVTATIGLPKTGLLVPQAVPFVGSLDVINIGIPADLADQYACKRELITGWDIRRHLPRRPRLAHKGQYGHVLIIGGATGFSGAAALAARAATRSGVGLTTVLTPRPVYPIVAGNSLEAMTHPGSETETGSLSIADWEIWKSRLTEFDAVVLGPGMTRHPDTAMWVRHLLRECRRPLLLDADALNTLEGDPELIARAQCPVVITPHPGELARLLGCSIGDIQADREGAAEKIATLTQATIVLKGAGTIVTQAGKALHINMTGNPGMATGGMGDALAGLIGGLLAQGLGPFEAACAGVFLHGRAGDNA
ncbi:MAG: NAD(P)H-hydrate dehydratase, partial [bacterium]